MPAVEGECAGLRADGKVAQGSAVAGADLRHGVRESVGGIVTGDRSVGALRQAITEMYSRQEDRAAVRKYAEQFSWDETTRGQIELFERLTAESYEARGRI